MRKKETNADKAWQWIIGTLILWVLIYLGYALVNGAWSPADWSLWARWLTLVTMLAGSFGLIFLVIKDPPEEGEL